MKTLSAIIVLFAIVHSSFAQYSKTANEIVPQYDGHFTFGTNPGWPTNAEWSSEQLADLYAGNAELGIPGIGANSVRATLPDHFLEQWGYDIRLDAYAYYKERGMHDLTCFIGFPSAEHTDTAYYGSKQSQMFKNMYEPIWDGGENGTPVNDNNYYALYVYNTALKYGESIRYWEIWNEPDYTSSSAASPAEGTADSWWTRPPAPDELDNLTAPFFHYIRLLRISYEVLKYVDEDDYVCLGGIGYKSFLDACLRYTDNPTDGSATDEYPLAGGAYFDCVSYHSYPMYFLRKWSNDIGGFEYSRHSDKAVEALLSKKADYETILDGYGYDGKTYPTKPYIITETNVPSMEFDWFYGTDQMQSNFLMKTIISAQMNGIQSLHTFALYEGKERAEAANSYHVMGMYRCLSTIEPYSQVANPSATACRTTMVLLAGCVFDADRTAALQLPSSVGGGAFRTDEGDYVYALWAKTADDKSEAALAEYTFPASFGIGTVESFAWDYTETQQTQTINGNVVQLAGLPVFLKTDGLQASDLPKEKEQSICCSPNPVSGIVTVDAGSLGVPQSAEIYHAGTGAHTRLHPSHTCFMVDMSAFASGVYCIRLQYGWGTVQQRMVKE